MYRRLFVLLFASNILYINGQTRTLGLTKYPSDHEEIFYLYTPLAAKKTFLINDCGELVNSWTSNYSSGVNQLLTNDGYLIRCGATVPPHFGAGTGGVLEKFDWAGNIVWSMTLSDTNQCLHHDIKLMPNGNILAIVWDNKTIAEAKSQGRRNSLATTSVWSEKIIEIKPIGTDSFDIVWEWSAWDHLVQDADNSKPNYGVIADHPELLNLNYAGNIPQDWLHANSVDYNANLDQIMISLHANDEFIIIDHSTTTQQAASHAGGKYGKGGDILYRWGNPQVYGRGISDDRQLFRQHHAHWIANGFKDSGKIMVFNNGWGRPDSNYSTLDIINPPQSSPGVYTSSVSAAFGPDSADIFFKDNTPTKFYSINLSGAYHLPSGNVLATLGASGTFVEVTETGSRVWEYINPATGIAILSQGDKPSSNAVFRCTPYVKNFAGFSGKDLTSKGEVERNPISPSLCVTAGTEKTEVSASQLFYPNPVGNHIFFNNKPNKAELISITGKVLIQNINCAELDLQNIQPGNYILRMQINNHTESVLIVKQ